MDENYDSTETEQMKGTQWNDWSTEICMPTPPDRVGREFIMKYFTIMNKSPENLHCFYTETANFVHDDIDPMQRRTISADSKKAIYETMVERASKYRHTGTKVSTVDAINTLGDGVIVQVNGEISFNEQPMRPFSQTIILIRKTPFHYFVQNDIFRFCDFVSEPESSSEDTIVQQPKPMTEDWGTQCEEFDSEPRADSTQIEDAAKENEVKLDTSDSGLSSDAEKVIMDIQSINLKNILQESRTITKESVLKRGPTPPVETEPPIESESIDNEISENHTQSFRDSCILMINNVVNPNIDFDDGQQTENVASGNGMAQINTEVLSETKGDDTAQQKGRYKKRKEKRKSKGDISRDKSVDEENKKPEIVSQNEPTAKAFDSSPLMNENQSPEVLVEKHEEKPEAPTQIDHETPKTAEKISYAELARAGKSEWVDELPNRRESLTEKVKYNSSLPRRNSRTEKTTPSHGQSSYEFTRSSPRGDILQVFIGNIPHEACEEDISQKFSRFGRLSRVRLLSNTRKEWLPRYAFINYESVQSVRQCLMQKNSFYWPNNSPDGFRLNVNGDPSIDVWDDSGNRKQSDSYSTSRDVKQSNKNFVNNPRETNNKRSPQSDDIMKNERYKNSART